MIFIALFNLIKEIGFISFSFKRTFLETVLCVDSELVPNGSLLLRNVLHPPEAQLLPVLVGLLGLLVSALEGRPALEEARLSLRTGSFAVGLGAGGAGGVLAGHGVQFALGLGDAYVAAGGLGWRRQAGLRDRLRQSGQHAVGRTRVGRLRELLLLGGQFAGGFLGQTHLPLKRCWWSTQAGCR